MKMFGKLFRSALSVAMVAFLMVNVASAQEAASNIDAGFKFVSASIASQKGNDVKVDFKLEGKDNVQSGIRYGLALVREVLFTGEIINERIYDDELTFEPGKTVSRSIAYEVPAYLKGEYDLYLNIKSDKGLTLMQYRIGKVTGTGSGQYVSIDNSSCSVFVLASTGEVGPYAPMFGVDVAKDEKLIARCMVKNGLNRDVNAKTKQGSYLRNTFGKRISERMGTENFEIKKGESKEITFEILKEDIPQAYDNAIELVDAGGKALSNSTIVHYVIQGRSATVQKVAMDKSSYAAGDTAKLEIFWTPSADSFEGARKPTEDFGMQMEVSVADGQGMRCSEPTTKTIGSNSESVLKLDAKISKACLGAVASARILDDKGTVLDGKNASILGDDIADKKAKNLNKDNILNKSDKSYFWPVVALSSIFIGIALFAIWKMKKSRDVFTKILVLAFLTGSALFGFVEKASAEAYCPLSTQGAGGCVYGMLLNINDPTLTQVVGQYNYLTSHESELGWDASYTVTPNEALDIFWGRFNNNTCDNRPGKGTSGVDVKFVPRGGDAKGFSSVQSVIVSSGMNETLTKDFAVNAPATEGEYDMIVTISNMTGLKEEYSATGMSELPRCLFEDPRYFIYNKANINHWANDRVVPIRYYHAGSYTTPVTCRETRNGERCTGGQFVTNYFVDVAKVDAELSENLVDNYATLGAVFNSRTQNIGSTMTSSVTPPKFAVFDKSKFYADKGALIEESFRSGTIFNKCFSPNTDPWQTQKIVYVRIPVTVSSIGVACGSAANRTFSSFPPDAQLCNSNSTWQNKTETATKFNWQCRGNVPDPINGSYQIADCFANRTCDIGTYVYTCSYDSGDESCDDPDTEGYLKQAQCVRRNSCNPNGPSVIVPLSECSDNGKTCSNYYQTCSRSLDFEEVIP